MSDLGVETIPIFTGNLTSGSPVPGRGDWAASARRMCGALGVFLADLWCRAGGHADGVRAVSAIRCPHHAAGHRQSSRSPG